MHQRRAREDAYRDLYAAAFRAAETFSSAADELRDLSEALPRFEARKLARACIEGAADRLEDASHVLGRELDRADSNSTNLKARAHLGTLAVGGLALLPSIVGGAAGGLTQGIVQSALETQSSVDRVSAEVEECQLRVDFGVVVYVYSERSDVESGAVRVHVLWKQGAIGEQPVLVIPDTGTDDPVWSSKRLWRVSEIDPMDAHSTTRVDAGNTARLDIQPLASVSATELRDRLKVGSEIYAVKQNRSR